jgi:hypothetical protein
MFRSLWFWIVIILIAVGIALTAALGVLYWLLGAFVLAVLMLLTVLLAATDAFPAKSLLLRAYSRRLRL